MFTLDHVVPWGRSFDEYRRMFALTEDDLRTRILGCADGPASFNAEATARSVRVVSADPLYRWTPSEIRGRIAATSEEVLKQTRTNRDEFVWTEISSVEALGATRMQAMSTFLEDYQGGRGTGRYVAAALPALPFADSAFDIALCSHFLFLYSTQESERFHLAAADELCRIAADVRIFPLLALGSTPSPHVSAVANHLRAAGHQVSIDAVPYEFQRGGNQMLRVTTRARRAGGAGRGHGTPSEVAGVSSRGVWGPSASVETANFIVRLAQPADIPVLQRYLIARSARALSVGFYTASETEAAIRHVFGVDSRLIDDGTYFAVQEGADIVGCGGWSRRRTLYGGDQRRVGEDALLDPRIEAARIRAFFVAAHRARHGIGRRILDACFHAAAAEGFSRLELMATLPGVPLYAACGFHEVEAVTDVLPDGTPIRFIRMDRTLGRHERSLGA